jgi:hypothetical protein
MRSDPHAESWTAARYPERAAMKLWIPTAHTLSLSGGFMVGLFYGDHVFRRSRPRGAIRLQIFSSASCVPSSHR